MLTTRLLDEDNGPVSNHDGVHVAQKFRAHLYSLNWMIEGDRVFLQLWNNTPNQADLDTDSLYWIMDKAVGKNYLAVVQELWDHPARQGLSLARYQSLLE